MPCHRAGERGQAKRLDHDVACEVEVDEDSGVGVVVVVEVAGDDTTCT